MSWIHMLISAAAAVLTSLPLASKWELGARRIGLAMTAIATVWALVISRLGRPLPSSVFVRGLAVWVMSLATGTAFLAYRFYRDPDRDIPERDDVVLSPADGSVLYVRESRDGMIPVSSKNGRSYPLEELTKTPLQSQNAHVIGIAMNFLDVHINRAPIEGQITLQRHFKGTFASLKQTEALTENERATTLIERDGLQVGVVQIASRLVRQIVSFVQEGEHVALGQRIGVIRFGSQVDLIIPKRDDLRITVRPGDQVTAGESIVAELRSSNDSEEVGTSPRERMHAVPHA